MKRFLIGALIFCAITAAPAGADLRSQVSLDPIMNVWDNAPLLPILREAGGTFTDWQGRRTIHSGQGIACNGRILEEVLAIVGALPD